MNNYSISRCIAELKRVRDTYEAVETFNQKAGFTADMLTDAIEYIGMLEEFKKSLKIVTGIMVISAMAMFGLLFLI